MHIVKLTNCMLYINMYSLSALYMLQSVPIVKVILVILFKKKKTKKNKKKNKKTKNDPYFSMGKNTKFMPQEPRYLSFPWEREGILRLQLYIKLKLSVLSALPSSTQNIFQIQALCGRCTPKFTQN